MTIPRRRIRRSLLRGDDACDMRNQRIRRTDGIRQQEDRSVALGANATIAVGKFAVGILTGSAAMLAEAAHSVADTVNQGFLLVSINLSDNPADDAHPYRHRNCPLY